MNMAETPTMNTDDKSERVAICVCSNGRDSLIQCLRAILRQDLPGAAWVRVILVDNTSTGGLAARLAEEGLAGEITVVHEPRPGIPMARNAALEAALAMDASLVAFIDDDEIGSVDWLPSLHAVMVRADADVVQGRQVQVESFDEALARAASSAPEEQATKIRVRRTASTCNVLFRSWLLTQPNELRFDEAFAQMGSDTEFFMRAADAGAIIIHTTAAPVFEAWPADRKTLTGIRTRSWQGGAATHYRYRKNRSAPIALGILLPRALWRAVTGSASLTASLLPGKDDARASRRERGNARLFFALGCLSPYLGIRPRKYR